VWAGARVRVLRTVPTRARAGKTRKDGSAFSRLLAACSPFRRAAKARRLTSWRGAAGSGRLVGSGRGLCSPKRWRRTPARSVGPEPASGSTLNHPGWLCGRAGRRTIRCRARSRPAALLRPLRVRAGCRRSFGEQGGRAFLGDPRALRAPHAGAPPSRSRRPLGVQRGSGPQVPFTASASGRRGCLGSHARAPAGCDVFPGHPAGRDSGGWLPFLGCTRCRALPPGGRSTTPSATPSSGSRRRRTGRHGWRCPLSRGRRSGPTSS
jgi:hypothetical protein